MTELSRGDMERDAKLAALYRAASQDEPPPGLDDAIRAAARRAVASKPRLASSPFSRSWRVPLSIAAVLVLSVSLVTLMREEAPEMTQSPGAELSLPQSAVERQPAESAPAAEGQTPAIPKTLKPDYQQPSGLGLKASSSSSSEGIRRDAGSVASVAQLRNERAAAGRTEAQTPATPSLQASPEAFPGAAAVGSNKGATSAGPARLAAKEEARRDIAATEPQRPLAAAVTPAETQAPARPEADSNVRESARARAQAVPVPPAMSVTVPTAKPAVSPPAPVAMEKRAPQTLGMMQSYTSQSPEKWLEQIEDLRKQGRLEEARASLADFRRRYPDHQLPAALKEWVKP